MMKQVDKVTRRVCGKIDQNEAIPYIFVKNLCITLTVAKSCPKIWAISVIFIKLPKVITHWAKHWANSPKLATLKVEPISAFFLTTASNFSTGIANAKSGRSTSSLSSKEAEYQVGF
jgi:hypothetical protein